MASIHRLSPVLAIAAGVLHAGLSPVFAVAGVTPNLLLVATVLVSVRHGVLAGATWAFAGGLTANLLAGEPLGAVPLSLLPLAASAPVARILSAVRPLFVVVATFGGSMLADGIVMVLRSLVAGETWMLPMEIVVRAAALNAGIAAVALAVAWLIAVRRPHVAAAT